MSRMGRPQRIGGAKRSMAADVQRVSERDRMRALQRQRCRPQPPRPARPPAAVPPGDDQADRDADHLRRGAPPELATNAQISPGGHTCGRCGQVIVPGDREALSSGEAGWVHFWPCLLGSA